MPKRKKKDYRKEFEEVALVHLDILYNTAVQMTRNVADAEDLIQETFVKAYRFFDKFKKGTNCKAWLFKIMKNSYINRFRKKAKEPLKVDYKEIENSYLAEVKRDFQSLETVDVSQIFEDLLEDDVKNAIDSLPFEFKMVVILADIQGLSYQEVADIMECPIGTVRSRLSRARRILQKKLYDFAKQRGIIKAKK